MNPEDPLDPDTPPPVAPRAQAEGGHRAATPSPGEGAAADDAPGNAGGAFAPDTLGWADFLAPSLLPLIVDARMIEHSGIGIYLQGLLTALLDSVGRGPVALLGDGEKIRRRLGAERLAGVAVIPFDARLYSPGESGAAVRALARALEALGLSSPQEAVLFWPHYNVPLGWKGPLLATVHDLIHVQWPQRRISRWYMEFWLLALRRRLRAGRGATARRSMPGVSARRRAAGAKPTAPRCAPAFLLTDSRHVKVLLQRQCGFPAEQVLEIGCGVSGELRPPFDEAEFLAARTALFTGTAGAGLQSLIAGAAGTRRYVLFVGLDKPHKNLDLLLGTLRAEWLRGGWGDLGLVIAGSNDSGALAARLRKDELFRERVVVLPRVDRSALQTLFWGAEALVFPSRIEGFGLPVLEAMACATPVVCSRLAPMTEVAGDAAIYFDPLSSDSLRSALRRVLDSGGAGDEALAALAATSDAGLDLPFELRRRPAAVRAQVERGIDRAGTMTWDAVATRFRAAWERISDLAAEAAKSASRDES